MSRNNKLTALLIGTATAVGGLLFLTMPGHSDENQRAPFQNRNFAHRGLYEQNQTVPENSLEAFKKAVDNGYGIELDVQLSSDGYVVVFHDDNLKRACGIDEKVSEKTLNELKSLKLFDTSSTIPLFQEVLNLVDGKVPIICELKMGSNKDELCRKTLDMIKAYKGDICIESFDPFIVRWFKENADDVLRGQLSSPHFDTGNPFVMFLASNLLFNFLGRPQFIAYKICEKPLMLRINHLLGCMKVSWTAHDESSEKDSDAVIFEYYLPKPKY